MGYRRFLVPLFALLLALAAVACSGLEPYVYLPSEFNRGSPDFGRDPTDIKAVAICYNSRSITPEALREMARAECARFDKVARFSHQDTLRCPIITPVGAHFKCVRP